MWERHRIRRLEVEVAEARTGQEELRRRLGQFEQIAAATGRGLPDQQWWQTAAPAAPLPPTLIAAAREQGKREEAVWLEAAGTDVIAIIGGPGDPEDWWSAVWGIAGRAGGDR